MTYGEEVPKLTYTPDVPDGYTLTTPTLSLGDYNAETGTRAIILSNAWVADGNGTALDAAQLELTVNNGTLTVAKRDINSKIIEHDGKKIILGGKQYEN